MYGTPRHTLVACTAVLLLARLVVLVGGSIAFVAKTIAAEGPRTGDRATSAPASRVLKGEEFPQPIALRDIHAGGPLHELLKKSYAHLLRGPGGFGSDWSDPNEPGDGRGRWLIAICNYSAYLHEKPQKMLDEMQRMKTMRNSHGFFGLDKPLEVIQAQASYDNSWPIQWGIDYTRYFGDRFGVDFASSIADAFYVAKLPFYEPYAEQPTGHWMGEYGHRGIGLGGMVGVARLATVTGEDRYVKAARGLADLLLHTNYIGWHGHATSTAVLGLLYTYEITGDRRYLDAAVQAVDKVFLGFEMPYMGHAGGIFTGIDHSEGCGVADYFRLNMEIGRLTGQARYFDKAEKILWGTFFHHIRPSGGMGVDGLDPTRTQLKLHSCDWAYDADMCCSMWASTGLVGSLTHAILAENTRLTLPFYYPFVAAAQLKDGKKVKLSMETTYPNNGAVNVRILHCDATSPWSLRLRVPAWSELASLKVNGDPQQVAPTEGWLTLERAWKAGDEVALTIPLPIWLSRPNSDEVLSLPDTRGDVLLKNIRLFRGPLLLAVEKSRNPELAWPQKERLTLLLPSPGSITLDNLPKANGFDRAFVYRAAHLKVSCAQQPDIGGGNPAAQQAPAAPLNTGATTLDQVKTAVLTPIAEAPGRIGASPEIVKRAALADREAVLFNVILLRGARVHE